MSYKKDNPEIQKATGASGNEIHNVIQEYKTYQYAIKQSDAIGFENGYEPTQEEVIEYYNNMISSSSNGFPPAMLKAILQDKYGYSLS